MGYKVYNNWISASPAFLLLSSMVLLKININFLSLFPFCSFHQSPLLVYRLPEQYLFFSLEGQHQSSEPAAFTTHRYLTFGYLKGKTLKNITWICYSVQHFLLFLQVTPHRRRVLTHTSLTLSLRLSAAPALAGVGSGQFHGSGTVRQGSSHPHYHNISNKDLPLQRPTHPIFSGGPEQLHTSALSTSPVPPIPHCKEKPRVTSTPRH